MALTIGTNCGFVTSAPVDDPDGGLTVDVEYRSRALKVTSPATAVKIVEVGWWCDTANNTANFEMGLYDDNSGAPKNRLYVNNTNNKGTTAGWKRVTVDWEIDPSTVYWIAMQLDNTSTTRTDRTSSSTSYAYTAYGSTTSLDDPFPSHSISTSGPIAFYAVWEAASGTNAQINIGDSWKKISAMKINIGDSWKEVAGAKINIGDSWKTIF